MKKNIFYLFILHIVLAIYSFLGIFSKYAAGEKFLSPKFILYYGLVILGLFIYAVVWQQLLKKLPLITAYANKAVTVIWGIIWGRTFFTEPVTPKKITGAIIIIVGVYFVVSSDYAPKDKTENIEEVKENTDD